MVEKVIKLTADANDAIKKTEQLNKNVKNVDKSTSIASKGFKTLGAALKATGIGLVVALVAKLTQAFSQNQKVVDAVSGVFNGISIIFTQLTDAIINTYESVSEATGGFDALGKVMGGLLTLVINPFKASFFAIKLALQQTQLAWEQSFFGDDDPKTIKRLNEEISKTKDTLKELGEEFVEAGVQIVANASEALDEVSQIGSTALEEVSKISVKTALEQGKALTQAKNAAELAQVELQGLIEKYDRQAEIQRQIRDDERLSIDERIKANDELGKILEEQLDAQLRLANQRVKAAQLEISATGNNIENQKALKEALNEVAAVEAQITGFASEQRVNEAALQKERLENLNEIALIGKTEQERKQLEAEQELERQRILIEKTISNEQEKNEALRQAKLEYERTINEDLDALLEEFRLKREEKQQETELQKIEAEEAKKLKELDDLNATEEQKLQIENYYRDLKAEAQDKADQEELARKRALEQQKIALVQTSLGNLSNALDKSSKAGKAVAVAQALINTYQGITTELATKTATPFEFGLKLANIASVAAIGFKSVKDIVSTKTPNVGSITGTGGGGASGGGAPATPQFNIVGQDSQSQIGQAIGQQEQQPVQAYVVANDVTTAQSLNNNIVDGASLG
jgi:hypothetical protein